ncbi:MAG: serine dehydrogenasease [Proteobacteria bacterium]|nr:serine dehydrogenasease [Pseudomonadota bacterium]
MIVRLAWGEPMESDSFDRSIIDLIHDRARKVEDLLKADVVFYSGLVHPAYFRIFRDFIESVKERSDRKEKAIAIFLRTAGGSVETSERMVGVLRKHYDFVYFIVPDTAMSAGTILCMSGDKIYMDYSSSLGPVDPQAPTSDTGEYLPAMGYLDKVEEISSKDDLTPADDVFLRSLDLCRLALYEQSRDLSIDLLKKWLVQYKFKDWNKHQTTDPGSEVTEEQKLMRATEIATNLADLKKWRTHGRNIDILKLQEMRLFIDDYSDNDELSKTVREYNDPLTGYVDRTRQMFYMQNHLMGD